MAERTEVKTDPIITTILETREKHARMQNKDYSHVFRKKSFIEILRLTALGIGIGAVYASEQVFVTPTLLKLGLDYTEMSMVWSVSPVLGLLVGTAFFGSISDRCRLNFGRRRPVLLLVSLGVLAGFCFLPFGKNIGQFFGDDALKTITDQSISDLLPKYMPNLKFAIIFTILGVVIMDFSIETCQCPFRAYILDVCITEDHSGALTTFSVLVGLGSAIGYATGAIDWESTSLGGLFGGNMQLALMMNAFVFVICFFITILSFREIPLPLIEKDKLLRPLKVVGNKNEFCKDHDKISSFSEVQDNNYAEIGSVSLGKYLKSIIVMPKSMWILCLTNLLCWMGHVCYFVYFTDFVGEAVFHGDLKAPIGSEKFKLYEAGVRFAGWGLTLSTFAGSGHSFIVEKLIKVFKIKFVYISGIMVYAIGMFILAAWPNKIGALFLSITAGIIYSTMNTVPFILVANYHAKNCFEVRKGENILLEQPRGLATDIGIISSMLFLGQLIISLSMGYLVIWTETKSAIFYSASFVSLCAAVLAMFVLYI